VGLSIGVLFAIVASVVPYLFSSDCITARGAAEILSFSQMSGSLYLFILIFVSFAYSTHYAGALGAIALNGLTWVARRRGWVALLKRIDETVESARRDKKIVKCGVLLSATVGGFLMFALITHVALQTLGRMHNWDDLVQDRERMRNECRSVPTESAPFRDVPPRVSFPHDP